MNLDIPSQQTLGVVYRQLYKTDPKLNPVADLQIAERALLDSDIRLDAKLVEHDASKCEKITSFEDYRRKAIGRRLQIVLNNLRYYRKLVRDCYSAYLTPAAYSRIVRNHTRWKIAYVKVKPERIVEVAVPERDTYHLVHHSKTEWLSHSNYLKWKLARCNRTSERHKLEKAIHYLLHHPEKDIPRYKEVLTLEWWTRELMWPRGYFGKRRKFVRQRKMIPVRDWDAIWQSWSMRRKRCIQRALPYLNKIGPLENELASLRSQYYATPKRCVAQQSRFPITLNSSLQDYTMPDTTALQLGADLSVATSMEYEELPLWSCRTRCGLIPTGLVTEPSAYWDLPAITDSLEDKYRWIYSPQQRCHGFISAFSDESGTTHVLGYQPPGITGFNPVRLMPAGMLDIEVKDHSKPAEDDALFRERRLMSFHKLMNLRCGSRASVVNGWRSILEQKDLPQTHRTLQEFGLFCRSFQNGGIGGYRVVVGKRAYYVANNSQAWMRFARVYAIRSWRQRERAYRALGITSINPVRRKTLKMACALYLCWKFGIEQTLNDAQYFASQYKKSKPFVRELLAQLKPNRFGVVTPRVRYATPTHGHPLSRKKEEPYLDEAGIEQDKTYSVVDHIDLTPLFAAISQQNWGSVSYPTICCHSVLGLPVPYPVTVAFGETDKIAAYNAVYLKEFFVPWFRQFCKAQGIPMSSLEVHVDRVVRGSVLAQFGRNNLTRAMEPSMRNLIESVRLCETAWELAPMSFVVEWFSNIGQLVRASQDMLSRTSTKLNPIGPVWETLRQDLYIATSEGRYRINVTLTPDPGPAWFLGKTTRMVEPDSEKSDQYSVDGVLYPTQVEVKWTITRMARPAAQWEPPRRLSFTRRTWVGERFELPPLDFRLNLNPGKLGSLLAIYLNQAL